MSYGTPFSETELLLAAINGDVDEVRTRVVTIDRKAMLDAFRCIEDAMDEIDFSPSPQE